MNPVDWPTRAQQACALATKLPSPCNAVCTMTDSPVGEPGWCRGCWRSLAEIGAWAAMSDEEKRNVWRQLPARAAKGGV